MKAFGKVVAGLILLLAVAMFVAWATAPDPKFNPATFEDEPVVVEVAPFEDAITLAQFPADNGTTRTVLVTNYESGIVTGIDLATFGGEALADPFEALTAAELPSPETLKLANYPTVEVPVASLLPTGTSGTRHIGIGTNFPEHAEEANSSSVFQFPKFGPASPARTTLTAREGLLLDYEVELCMRFDRDIISPEDFDAAVKGVFLCGDFTDRNALVYMADPENLDSGRGFSDSKSGLDSYPSGPFLIIPRDWKAFTADVRMTTSVNDEPRQDARGGEMTLDFRKLAEKALGDMDETRFLYRDKYYRLAEGNRIDRSTTLMSGTSEGVIFTQPTRADYVEVALGYLARGGPFASKDFDRISRDIFIANELDGGHFLQPGDKVRHASNWLGDIEVTVIPAR